MIPAGRGSSVLAATHAREGSVRPSCLPDTHRAEAPRESVRNTEYAGKREITPGAGGRPLLPGEVALVDPSAALSDVMPFMRLADDLTVSAVMTTESDLLCYTY